MTRTTDAKPRPTKAQIVQRMLSRKAGADQAALQKATGWQPHSVRAALSILRKKGYTIAKLPPKLEGGAAAYRITGKPEGA